MHRQMRPATICLIVSQSSGDQLVIFQNLQNLALGLSERRHEFRAVIGPRIHLHFREKLLDIAFQLILAVFLVFLIGKLYGVFFVVNRKFRKSIRFRPEFWRYNC